MFPLLATVAVLSILPAPSDAIGLYSVYYRTNALNPWTFYSTSRGQIRAQQQAAELQQVGYQTEIVAGASPLLVPIPYPYPLGSPYYNNYPNSNGLGYRRRRSFLGNGYGGLNNGFNNNGFGNGGFNNGFNNNGFGNRYGLGNRYGYANYNTYNSHFNRGTRLPARVIGHRASHQGGGFAHNHSQNVTHHPVGRPPQGNRLPIHHVVHHASPTVHRATGVHGNRRPLRKAAPRRVAHPVHRAVHRGGHPVHHGGRAVHRGGGHRGGGHRGGGHRGGGRRR